MSSLQITRNWILGGYGLEYSEQRSISAGALSDLIDGFLRTVLPLLTTSSEEGTLTDLKGRNAHDLLIPGIVAAPQDELFRMGGTSPLQATKTEFDYAPFEVSLLSPFKRFEGAHHIVHQLEPHRSGSLPEWLPLRLLGYAAPIKPRFLRFGIERFRSILSFASLGYAPQVTDSLLVDCVGGSFAIRVTSEQRKRSSLDPFEEIPAFRAVSQVLKSALQFDLQGDVNAALTEHK